MPNDVSAAGHYRAYRRQPVIKQPGLDEPVIFRGGGPKAFFVNVEGGCHHGCDCSGWGAFARNRLDTLFTLGAGVLLDKILGGSGRNGGLGGFGSSSIWGNSFGSYNVGAFNIDMSNPGRYIFEAAPKGGAKAKDKPVADNDNPVNKSVADNDNPVNKPVADNDKPVKKPVTNPEDNPDGNQNALKGKKLLEAINGDNAGKVTSRVPGRQDTASLKKDDRIRKTWADTDNAGNKSTLGTNDQKDAVRLGTSNNTDANATAGPNKDYPKYFTITDYRSHNEYTFEFAKVENGKVYYKWNKTASNLDKDGKFNEAGKYNSTNWIENSSFDENTLFEVTLEDDDEIHLTYDGSTSVGPMAKKKVT